MRNCTLIHPLHLELETAAGMSVILRLQRTMPLRQPRLVDVAARLLCIPIVRASVRVQGTEEPMRLDALPQAAQAAQGPFFLDEEGGVDLAGSIIERHDQIPLTAGHPFMGGAVLVQHHARQGFTGMLFAMRPASRRAGHMPRRLQGFLRPAIGPRPAMLGAPVFVEMLDGPARVPRLIQGDHAQHLIDRHRAGRGATQATVLQPLGALGIIAPPPAAKRPLRHPQHLGRVPHRQFPPLLPRVEFLKPHLSHLLSYGRPCHGGPP